MGRIRVARPLLRWGNAYGLRVTKAEAETLGVREKQTVDADLRTGKVAIDLSRYALFQWPKDSSRRHNEIAEEAAHAGD